MPDKRRARIFAVLSILIGTCGALGVLALGELAVRLGTTITFHGNSANLFTPNRFGTSRGNTPKVRALAFHEPVYIDGNGFRIPSPDYQYPSTKGDRVLILGDSVAFGPGVPEEKTFVGELRASKPDWAVFNSAVLGYSLFDYVNVIRSLLQRHKRYTLVVLVMCLNDVSGASALFLEKPTAPQPSADSAQSQDGFSGSRDSSATAQQVHSPGGTQRLSLVERARSIPAAAAANDWLREHSKLYLYLKGILTDPSARYFQADYLNYDDRVGEKLGVFLSIADELRRAGIPLLIVISPYEYQLRLLQDQAAMRRTDLDVMLPQKKIQAYLTAHGLTAFDAIDFFRSQGGAKSKALFLPFDPMHFSAKGHFLMYRFLQELLKSQKLK